MTAEDVTGSPESIADMTADVRELRDRVARQMSADLTDAQVRAVAGVADVILGMTIAERGCLAVLLRDVQARPRVDLA